MFSVVLSRQSIRLSIGLYAITDEHNSSSNIWDLCCVSFGTLMCGSNEYKASPYICWWEGAEVKC